MSMWGTKPDGATARSNDSAAILSPARSSARSDEAQILQRIDSLEGKTGGLQALLIDSARSQN